jgi:hypothetical protein
MTNQLTQLSLLDVRDFFSLPNFSPKAYLDESFSLIYDSAKNTATLYFMVDSPFNNTTALFSQTFKLSKEVWKPAAAKSLIKNIFAKDDSDAKAKGFYDLEKSLAMDLDGDGLVGSSIYIQQSGVKVLGQNDLSILTDQDAFTTLGLGANGRAGTTLTINENINKPIVIGMASTDYDDIYYADALMSTYQIPFPSVFAGFGMRKSGVVNINNSEVYVTGGIISSYVFSALNLSSEYANMVIGGLGAGFGPGSNGTLNIKNSELLLQRNRDSLDLDGEDADVFHANLLVGIGGAKGVTVLDNTDLTMRGTDNHIGVADEASSTGTLNVRNGSNIVMRGEYSVNDEDGNEDLAFASFITGYGTKSNGMGLIESSTLSMRGLSTDMNVGIEGGKGTFTINNSRVEQIGQRVSEPLTRSENAMTEEDYLYAWSGSYLQVGYDEQDGNARTNNVTSGLLTLNNSNYSIKGPHAGVEVGGSGTKSTGRLDINNTTLEVIGSGALLADGADGTDESDYLSAGINSSGGDPHTGYSSFFNVGGSGWKDFGGVGTVNVLNNSSVKIFEFEITSGDSILSANDANMEIGGWGTKAGLLVDGSSDILIGGEIRLGLRDDLSPTNYNRLNGLNNVSNYSMVHVKNGEIEAHQYSSQLYTQNINGNNSPLTKFAMYTVLGNAGTITANQFFFDKNSQIIGSGKLVVDDVLSGRSVTLQHSLDTSQSYTVSDFNTENYLQMRNAEIAVGDVFNFDKLTKTEAIGTLTFDGQLSDDQNVRLEIQNTKFFFGLSNGQSDRIDLDGFNDFSFSNNTFVVKGKGLAKGSQHVLVDFEGGSSGADDLLGSINLQLIGVKGSLSLNEDADLIFTVA